MDDKTVDLDSEIYDCIIMNNRCIVALLKEYTLVVCLKNFEALTATKNEWSDRIDKVLPNPFVFSSISNSYLLVLERNIRRLSLEIEQGQVKIKEIGQPIKRQGRMRAIYSFREFLYKPDSMIVYSLTDGGIGVMKNFEPHYYFEYFSELRQKRPSLSVVPLFDFEKRPFILVKCKNDFMLFNVNSKTLSKFISHEKNDRNVVSTKFLPWNEELLTFHYMVANGIDKKVGTDWRCVHLLPDLFDWLIEFGNLPTTTFSDVVHAKTS